MSGNTPEYLIKKIGIPVLLLKDISADPMAKLKLIEFFQDELSEKDSVFDNIETVFVLLNSLEDGWWESRDFDKDTLLLLSTVLTTLMNSELIIPDPDKFSNLMKSVRQTLTAIS